METTTQAHESGSARVCEHPECDREVGPLNRSGRCAKHFHWKGTGKARSSPGARHASAGSNGANGQASETASVNGSATIDADRPTDHLAPIPTAIREDRADRVILSWSLAEKTRIVQAWLAGEL